MRKILGAVIVLAVALGAYLILRSPASSTPEPSVQPSTTAAGEELPPAMPESESQDVASDPGFNQPPPPNHPTDPSAYDEEAGDMYSEDDLPPASNELLEIAHRMAPVMEKALESEKEALPAYARLENCVKGGEGANSVQAKLVCYANASRLAEEYPASIGPKFKHLTESNPELMRLLETPGME